MRPDRWYRRGEHNTLPITARTLTDQLHAGEALTRARSVFYLLASYLRAPQKGSL
jgi:hypothetical protein